MAERHPPTIVRVQDHIKELGPTELIGKDEQVDTNEFGAEVSIAIGASGQGVSGEILNVLLISSGGDKLAETGRLCFFESQPTVTIALGDMTLAQAKLLIGYVEVAAADWKSQGGTPTVKTAFFSPAIAFQSIESLWMAYLHTGATQWNSAGGDNEVLDVNVRYRVDIDET